MLSDYFSQRSQARVPIAETRDLQEDEIERLFDRDLRVEIDTITTTTLEMFAVVPVEHLHLPGIRTLEDTIASSHCELLGVLSH
jgi:hypothetical protein